MHGHIKKHTHTHTHTHTHPHTPPHTHTHTHTHKSDSILKRFSWKTLKYFSPARLSEINHRRASQSMLSRSLRRRELSLPLSLSPSLFLSFSLSPSLPPSLFLSFSP